MLESIVGIAIGLIINILIVLAVFKFIIWMLSPKQHNKSQEFADKNYLLNFLKNQRDNGKNLETIISELETLNSQDTLPKSTYNQTLGQNSQLETKTQADLGLNSEKNILLLMYLGALLIIISASAFVGFNWESISNVMKVGGIIAVTVAFYFSGIYIYGSFPKIKSAGVTFATIGAMLIPFCGVAYHNFLSNPNESFATPWIITSLVSLSGYIYLANKFKNTFFSYITALSTLSLIFSFINLAQIDNRFYILGSIATCYILYGFARLSPKMESFIREPFTLTAQIILPFTLVYGLIVALSNGSLFDHTTALAIFLSAVFYWMIYKDIVKTNYFILAVSLGYLALGIEIQTIKENLYITVLSLIGVGILLFLISVTKKFLSQPEWDLLNNTLVITVLISVEISYLANLLLFENSYHVSDVELIILLGSTTVFMLGQFWFRKIEVLLGMGLIGIGLTGALYINEFVNVLDKSLATGTLFSVLGTISWLLHKFKLSKYVTYYLFYLFALISLLLTNNSWTYTLATSVLPLLILAYLSLTEEKDEQTISTTLLMWYVIYTLLDNLLGIRVTRETFYTALCTTGIIITSLTLIEANKKVSSHIYWFTIFITTIWILTLKDLVFQQDILLSAVFLVLNGILLCWKGFIQNRRLYKYIGSFFFLFAYFWLLESLQVSEALFMIIPTGVHLLTLGYMERTYRNTSEILLDLMGFFWLFVGLLYSTESNIGYIYGFSMILLGFAFSYLGIVWNLKRYKISSIIFVAVGALSQLYKYILTIPSWAITSIMGLLILGVAVYLLYKRSSHK